MKPAIRFGWVWRVLAAIYASIFLVILFLAYNGKLPAILTQNDKLAHLILYGIATYIGHRVCDRRWIRWSKLTFPLFPTLFVLFTTAEELFQSLSPNRSLDLMDLIASFAGIGLGYWLSDRGRRKAKGGRMKTEG